MEGRKMLAFFHVGLGQVCVELCDAYDTVGA